MKYNKKLIRSVARVLLLVLTYELVEPNVAMALTTGPTQPEVQSFEPVGTTDMVDMFTGDFVYNVPLMDVEGYPVNISYHGGIGMEQEASWVGLGWNINPGAINRSVRGIPDDFNGQTLSKELNIKPETILRFGVGIGGELAGLGDPLLSLSANIGAEVNISNYRGVSCDLSLGGGVNVFNAVSAGVNIGVGSQTGASIDYNAGVSFCTSQIVSKDLAAGIGITAGSGYSTRSGIKDLSLTWSANASSDVSHVTVGSFTANIPIGIKNYVPVITNSSTMNSLYGRIKVGGEAFWCQLYGDINAMKSTLNYNDDGSRASYGYMYLQNAQNNNAILDFSRDKDGMFNKSMQYLAPGNMTYDIYSVSGQGTGGNFRPFRNDLGSVYDPVTNSSAHNISGQIEAAIGDLFEVGADLSESFTNITSGPWTAEQRGFAGRTDGKIYEDVYFKQGGELTEVDQNYFDQVGGAAPVDASFPFPGVKSNSVSKRDARGNLIYYLKGTDAVISGVGTNPSIINYTSINGFSNGAVTSTQALPRYYNSGNDLQKRGDQISEIVQLQKDGKRYVYGIPAMNNIQREVTFSVDPPGQSDLARGLVQYNGGVDDSKNNQKGIDHYYSSTTTPAYAHSYLLTSVLSTDYVDVTGDGPTDDDLGAYTKFNYSLKENDFRWRAPIDTGTKAQYSPGFWSDPRDDKGSYLIGSREEWILHSIESKNFIAEFYTSKRNDAMGIPNKVLSSGQYNVAPYNQDNTDTASSYKLDSIKLFNKHDRFINRANAVPIKTVMFSYDYSLCNGVPNFRLSNGQPQPLDSTGKLTLKKIYVRYGNSDRSTVSPYQFTYSTSNPNYSLACKDRWGNYKPNNSGFTNYEFPYVDQQSDPANASAWSLTSIILPSGGTIQANYAYDDYAFVQDHTADEMFMVQGIGNSTNFGEQTGELYNNKNSPNLYFFFRRRQSSEVGADIGANYLNGLSTLYYNFNVRLCNNSFEQIKGYGTVQSSGVCTDNANYAYVQVAPVTPNGGGANLNPVSYTAVNTGRYNLPQIIFPGSDPNSSDITNVLAGLKGSFSELVSITQNPVVRLVEKGDGRDVNMSKCFMRLSNPGHKKIGGGHRISSLLFYDNWHKMTGGNTANATYGKQYDYTINDDTYGVISSGVASYEPMIGGDENPLRNPVQYTVQSGSSWPPNDPVDLYQETPIGESFFPAPVVGYRQVTVTSINAATGRSSQGIDVYQFYTSKDYPALVQSTGLNVQENENDFGIFSQKNLFAATQGYSLTFNDMHGKPKSVEHYVWQPQGNIRQLISYQQYNYKTSGGQLDNNIDVLVYQPSASTPHMVKETKQIGVETDVTIDTREKNEETNTDNLNANLNVSLFFIIPVPVPIPLGYAYSGDYQNRFRSAVATKVIQQYGILQQVVSYKEGAVTTLQNEVYDPATGQPIVTSVNNEYRDKEYSVNIPAYWGYKYMGPAYTNILYEDNPTSIAVQTDLTGFMYVGDQSNYNIGDELYITYSDGNGIPRSTMAFIMDFQNQNGCCQPLVLPRSANNTPGWTSGSNLTNVHIKVMRSGRRNQLNETIESYSMLGVPWDSNSYLTTNLNNLIDVKAKMFNYPTYVNINYNNNNTQLATYNLNNAQLNPFSQGVMGVYRLQAEYVNITDRTMTYDPRNAGLFTTQGAWQMFIPGAFGLPCGKNSATYDPNTLMEGAQSKVNCDLTNSYMSPNVYGNSWKAARTITKWSPNGKELENVDAIGNYSTAVYGYGQELPVAVASNAYQGEVLSEGFEDYNLLQLNNAQMAFNYSPFPPFFATSQLDSSSYNLYNFTSSSGLQLINNASHTGYYCLKIPNTQNTSFSGVYGISIPQQTGFSNQLLPFALNGNKSYVLSYWVRAITPNSINYDYAIPAIGVSSHVGSSTVNYNIIKRSGLIDGWQQIEVDFTAATSGNTTILLPNNYYVDDIRIYPAASNMKSFVYNPVNEKLVATLDENNYATFYEYDQEGNLVRTKKETEKGIMTISESRSGNPKQ